MQMHIIQKSCVIKILELVLTGVPLFLIVFLTFFVVDSTISDEVLLQASQTYEEVFHLNMTTY
jgi:hypothetical protein